MKEILMGWLTLGVIFNGVSMIELHIRLGSYLFYNKSVTRDFITQIVASVLKIFILGPLSIFLSIGLSRYIDSFIKIQKKEVYSEVFGMGEVIHPLILTATDEYPKAHVKFYNYKESLNISIQSLNLLNHEDNV